MPIMMKYDSVDGDVETPGYEKYILLEGVEWGFERNVSSVGADDANRARPTMQRVSLTMLSALPTTGLVTDALTGKHNRKVTICWARTSKTGAMETFCQLELTDAAVVAYKLGCAGDRPIDSFTLSYKQVELKTWSWKNDSAGSSRSASYNVETGR
jgi:type VI protein secretion system component Hcp